MTEYYERAGPDSRTSTQLGFHTVGYGCTTCIGNSGPLPDEISEAVAEGDLVVCAVLSGNRNFEARIHPEVKANYLASPPLVVAYALAGRMDIDLLREPLGQDADGNDVYLRDIWPTLAGDRGRRSRRSVHGEMFRCDLRRRLHGRRALARACRCRRASSSPGSRDSTYVRQPPYFEGMSREPGHGRGHRRRALPRHARRLGHDRPHLAGRRDQARLAGGRVPASSTASSARTSTRTARAAATTR